MRTMRRWGTADGDGARASEQFVLEANDRRISVQPG
jgi:hypothetical protein